MDALTTTQAVATITVAAGSAITPFTPVTASGGFGTLSFAVSPTLPSGLSLSTTTGQITGTPTALLSAMTYTVAVTDQARPTAQTSSKTFSLTISQISTAVTLGVSSSSSVLGAPVTFTATVVGGQSPTGTIAFKDASAVLATVAVTGVSASFTTTSLANGVHTITAVYSGDAVNLTSTSAPATYTVNARPNPALNPNVIGLVSAQMRTATRFAQSQVDNTARRLEQIHEDEDSDFADKGASRRFVSTGIGGAGGSSLVYGGTGSATGTSTDLKANAPYGTLNPSSVLGYAADPALSVSVAGSASGFNKTLPPQTDTGRALSKLGSTLPSAFEALNKASDLPFRIWAAGGFQFGGLQSNGTYDNRFTSSGLTIGVDQKFAGGFTAGLAIGAGVDHNSVSTDGTGATSTSLSATLYGTYKLAPHSFIDAMAGYGRLNFRTQRWSSDDNGLLNGSRQGADMFGAATFTQNVKLGDWKLSPYGRLQVINVQLNSSVETGSSIWALNYAKVQSTSVSVAMGTRITYPIQMGWGLLTPSARFEYAHAFGGAYAQSLAYADLPGQVYVLNGVPTASNIYTTGLMLKAELPSMLSLDLEYDFSVSGKQFQGNTIRFASRQRF